MLGHPNKQHIRIYRPTGVIPKVWQEHNLARIKSFALECEASPRRHGRWIDVFYGPGDAELVIEEVLRYAGVISVCRNGSNLD